jgi:histidinol-phosphate aminotransferase
MPRVVDLTWTGNHFLSEDVVRSWVHDAVEQMRVTNKGERDLAQLRREIGLFHDVDPRWVSVGCGSTHVLAALCHFFRSFRILDIIPNFHMTSSIALRDGLDYAAVPVRHPEDLIPAVLAARPMTNTLIVLSSPRNPFGYSFSIDTIRELLSVTPGPVIIDEAYAEFSPISVMSLVRLCSRLIVVRTFSKAWGLANLRVGYAVTAMLPERFQLESLLPYNVGELSSRVAARALSSAAIRESIELAIRARESFMQDVQTLPDVSVWPSHANFVCFETLAAAALADGAAACGIRVALLRDLRTYPSEWPDGVRVSMAADDVQARLVRAFAATVNAA